ncbi:MAG: hypothetical protein IPF94_14410 [Betaproteobacteria bacterium]|nr:hypothetical protein [Betaproteobacteria bacterium]
MTTEALETDYLVVGAGATAMAFVDTLLSEQARCVRSPAASCRPST